MRTKRVVAIIQARMGSSRLPGKVMAPIIGKPMLWHVVNRVKRSKLVYKVVVATSTRLEDKKIVEFCKKNGVDAFIGPEKNVLKRYYLAAKQYRADVIVRITADCPLIDPKIVEKSIRTFFKRNFDYLAILTGAGSLKSKDKKYPDGMDCEVFSFQSLEKAYREATSNKEREHVTVYIWRNPHKFKIGKLESTVDCSDIRLVVDTKEDFLLVRKIYSKLYKKTPNFGLEEILSLFKKKPELLKINRLNIGKEGYEEFWNEKERITKIV